MATGSPEHVLVVGINYAPEHTGIAPYTTAAARHLAERGHRVSVSTGIPHYPAWSVPDFYRWRLRSHEVLDGVEITRLRHFVPRSQDALRRAWYEVSFGVQVALNRRAAAPDVVLAVVPSLFGAAAGARVARQAGARLVIWMQDSMAAAAVESGMPGGRLVAGSVRRVERRVVRQADRVIVVSNGFRNSVQQMGVEPDRVTTLPNWVHVPPASDDRASTRGRLHWGADEFVVLHSGNMGLKQDLGLVVDAARLSTQQGLRLRFVLMGDGSQRAELESRARGCGQVEIIDAVPAADYSAVLGAADVLLVNERPGVLDMSLPSKLTSYFSSGRPVVAAADPRGGTAAEVRRSGAGVLTSAQTPEALLATVLDLLADPQRRDRLGRAGRRHAQENLTGESSLDRLAELVTTPYGDALSAPAGSAHDSHGDEPTTQRSA